MTDEELIEIVELLRRRGTDLEEVEAKQAARALPKRMWESLSAFANQQGGGIIILGLNETKGFSATGVEDVSKVQSDLASLCDEMEPALRPLIRVHDVEGVQLVVAEVPEVSLANKPCYYRGSGLYTGSCIRVGDGNRQMTQYEVNSLLESRGQPTHDLETVAGTSRADLDENLLHPFVVRVQQRREKLSKVSENEILQILHILGDNGQVTVCGLLCFANFPQKWFPNLTITFLRYPGIGPEEIGAGGERFLDNRRFDGPLPLAVDEALQTVVRAMEKRTLVQGLFRKEIPEYPAESIREALVNAVAHRDYGQLARGSQIQIQMYPNRLEIQNPGGLFGPVNEDNLGEPGVQATRNQYLMQLLEDLGPAENRGTGILTMVRAAREAQMSPPEFDDRRTYFRVVFPNETMLDVATIEWLNGFSLIDLNENQRLALAYTLHQEEVNNRIYCLLTGVDSRQATNDLHDLVGKGLLQQIGTRRWAIYRLAPKASQSSEEEDRRITALAGRKPVATERRERILRLISNRGSLAARVIAEELSIPRATVLYDLRILVDQKHIERTTDDPQDPRTEYRLPKST